MKSILYTRAWLIHIIMSFSKVVYPFLGIAIWQKAYDKDYVKEIPDLNVDLANESQSIVKYTLIAFIFIGILLDLVVWKYRNYAYLILYFELCNMCLSTLLPLKFGDVGNMFFLLTFIVAFFLYSCDMGLHIIATTIAFSIFQLCPMPIMYNEEYTIAFVIGKLLNSLFCFGICSVIGMLVTYIAQIRSRMK